MTWYNSKLNWKELHKAKDIIYTKEYHFWYLINIRYYKLYFPSKSLDICRFRLGLSNIYHLMPQQHNETRESFLFYFITLMRSLICILKNHHFFKLISDVWVYLCYDIKLLVLSSFGNLSRFFKLTDLHCCNLWREARSRRPQYGDF